MKKAALFLMISSTAFAAPQKVAPQRPPQLARKIVHTQRPPQAPLLVQPEALQATAPQTAGPQRARTVAKRAPRQAVTANVPSGLQAPKFGDFELKAQLRNTMTMAKAQELQNVDGQNFGLTTEVRAGLKHTSGWGFLLTAAHKTNNFADSAKNTGTNGDASLMLNTPSYFKTDFMSFSSIVRPYFPTSESSQANNIRSLEFRNFIDLTFGHKMTGTNFTLVRFFDRNKQGDGDLTSLVYNSFEFAHQTLSTAALSLGAEYEADNSYRNGTGTQVNVYPFIDWAPISNLLIEPKYYFPVFVGGNRSVDASGVALDQSKFELFIKLAI